MPIFSDVQALLITVGGAGATIGMIAYYLTSVDVAQVQTSISGFGVGLLVIVVRGYFLGGFGYDFYFGDFFLIIEKIQKKFGKNSEKNQEKIIK